ncbi:unnamed protein product [Allacma fusca]|uniref:Integrator complex subunit 1 n=1 Tax=Allacma fusca TaxID=39272 RepID=A0A8J2LH09_9HEXA|nr:unnamed protein product [Allacma fusca]
MSPGDIGSCEGSKRDCNEISGAHTTKSTERKNLKNSSDINLAGEITRTRDHGPEPEPRKHTSSSSTTPGSSRPGISTPPPSSSKSSVPGTSSSKSIGDKKRDFSSSQSSSSSSSAKKIRLHASGSSSSHSASAVREGSSFSSSSPKASTSPVPSMSKSKPQKRELDEGYDINPQDFTAEQFFSMLERGQKAGVQNLQPLMVLAMKRLKCNRDKPDFKLCAGLMTACQSHPQWFQTPTIIDIVYSIVSTKKSQDLKAKILQTGTPLQPFLICILTAAYGNVQSWPTEFFQMWVEDACGDRLWVDKPQCKPFVDNVVNSFETVLPSLALLQPLVDPAPPTPGNSSPLRLGGENEVAMMEEILQEFDASSIPILNRSGGSMQLMENIVLEHARDVIQKKTPDIPKNVLKALSSACGLVGVRAFAVLKLEIWIHHQKCSRQGQELLLHLCVNADAEIDNELVLNIAKLRLKTKPLILFFANCVKEMVRENEANMKSVLNYVLSNELSSQRNPSNFQILSTIMVGLPPARTLLAEIFMDLMTKREDQQQALRPMLREIVRSSRFEFELKSFVEGLTRLREISWRDSEIRDRTFMAITDLILLCMFLSLSPAVRESAVLKGDSKDMSTIHTFHANVTDIQEVGIFWLYTVVPRMFRPNKKEFGVALNKILLRDPMNDLVNKDGWPPESERSLFARLSLNVPLRENILMWSLLMGVSKDHPLNQPEILELVEFIIIRSATHKSLLELRKPEILDCLFRLCEYKHPENINLPLGYEPPKLAISKLYWKVWVLLCIISAHNPSTFGKMGWDTYPTIRVLMEMCMTSHFTFPTVASAETSEELHLKEMQISSLEKGEILQFEQHLAAASSKQIINEKNSLLLPQLIRMDPFGTSRTPPPSTLSHLMSINEQLHLGHHLCRSRSPDFLLDLIQRNSQPMPWLSELVAEGPIEILPVQCLCELMLGQIDKIAKALAHASAESSSGEKVSKKHKATEDSKNLQLLQHLQKGVHATTAEDNNSKEILEYFFRRLSSPKKISRMQALQGLQMLLTDSPKPVEENWLLDQFPTLPIFSEIQGLTISFLRQAIQVENEPEWIVRYLEFLSVWSGFIQDSEMDGLALDVAQLVVERNGVMSALLNCHSKAYDALFDIFLNYMKKIREPHKETYKWSESQDQVLVQWPTDRLECTMNILILHAIVILLSSYSVTAGKDSSKSTEAKKLKTGRGKSSVDLKYNDIQDMWFPKLKEACPKGYLLNTSEEAVLFPDWIKLRMIRSNNSRLLSSALQDLEADQLMLFVQSFGVPTQSMTALLYCLDKAVDENPDKVSRAIQDAQYMNTLVELQWKRGAIGGEKFSALLKKVPGIEEPMDITPSAPTEKFVVRPQMPDIFTKSSRKNAKVIKNSAVELKPIETVPKESKKLTSPKTPAVPNTEEPIRQLAKELLSGLSLTSKRRSSAPTDESVGENILGSVAQRRHSSFAEGTSSKEVLVRHTEGPLVDKLIELEPCIIKGVVDTQIPLLFERTPNPLSCRPFLLNVLAHQSSWKTVDYCISFFLNECETRYDPTNILDLIAATVKNPLLRHGGDKYVPKHQPELSMLKLNEKQLLVMAEYIVEEIACTVMKNTKFSITNLLGPAQQRVPAPNTIKPKQKLKERVRLWLLCCQHDKKVVNSTISQFLAKKNNSPNAKKFLAQLYLEFPEAILAGSWQECDELVMSDEELSSTLDTISFNLINSVATTQPGKEWQKKATQEMEVALRKLASVHPVLMLRQLVLMGALLEGRVHLDFSVFHSQNHHIPFKVYLGLWDFMQPQILKYFKTIKNALTLYLKLFENFGHLKDYSSELRRFCILLHNFWSKQPTEVEEFIAPYHRLIVDLAGLKYYIDVTPLHNLIDVLIPPQARKLLPTGTNAGGEAIGTPDFVGDPVGVFLDRIQQTANSDEIYPILQDLDCASNRNPSILESFSERLKSLMVCNNELCRTLAFSLILKHITYSPSSKDVYFESVMAALYTENSHIRSTFVERISEFIILSQERADEILMKLFELGISASVNVQPAITKTLAILRSYNGT